jgi:hypothetical protein
MRNLFGLKRTMPTDLSARRTTLRARSAPLESVKLVGGSDVGEGFWAR